MSAQLLLYYLNHGHLNSGLICHISQTVANSLTLAEVCQLTRLSLAEAPQQKKVSLGKV